MKQLLSFQKLTLLAPILLGISFILTFFSQNNGQLYLKVLPAPLILTIILGLLVVWITRSLMADTDKTVVYAAIFVIIFFTFGQTATLIESLPPIVTTLAKVNLTPGDPLLALYVATLVIIFFAIKNLAHNLKTLVKFLFYMSVISVCLPLALIFIFEFNQKNHASVVSPTPLPTAKVKINPAKLPDIYYIIPEDYSSPSVMQNYFHQDNTDFLSFIADRGLYYASQSASNYPKSFLSIASAMNMEYLDYLSKFKHSSDQSLVEPLIQNSNVLQFLRGQGYTFHQMGSWWAPTRFNPYADKNFTAELQHLTNIDDFSYAVLQSTMLRPFIDKLIPPVILTESDADKRSRILYQFAALPEVIAQSGPKFVFIHIIAPHDPWVFDANCKFIDNKISSQFSDDQNYANQATCLNEKLENALDQIITLSARPPVILLQSDEGAPFLGRRVNPADNWKTASVDLLKEKFPIFAMYYLPGISTKKAGLYPGITPVNSFRVILNAYFGTKLPLLPDREYIFKDINHLYEFQDVTSQIHQ